MSNKKPTYDQRTRNYYGHQAMNLKTREALRKAGAKEPKNPEDLPMADYRAESAAKTLKDGERIRKRLEARLAENDAKRKRR